MWIVRLALRRPYTFIVASILILILGTVVVIVRTPTDIFPNIDIPIISVIWNYNGLSPEEMSERIVYPSERGMTTTVSNVAHIDSQSWNGRSIVKIYFQPGTDIANAVAQVTSARTTAVAAHASRDKSAADNSIQRVHCAYFAAGPLRRGSERATIGGLWAEFCENRVIDNIWCSYPVAVRRKNEAGRSGLESGGTPIPRTFARRRGEYDRRPKI